MQKLIKNRIADLLQSGDIAGAKQLIEKELDTDNGKPFLHLFQYPHDPNFHQTAHGKPDVLYPIADKKKLESEFNLLIIQIINSKEAGIYFDSLENKK